MVKELNFAGGEIIDAAHKSNLAGSNQFAQNRTLRPDFRQYVVNIQFRHFLDEFTIGHGYA